MPCVAVLFLFSIISLVSIPVLSSDFIINSSSSPLFTTLKEIIQFPEIEEKQSVQFVANPPKGKYYHGTHPNTKGNEGNVTIENINSYISLSGKKVAWVYFSNEWFPWNAKWNGEIEGAVKFVQAYRRIINISREEGANNIIWVFHIDDSDNPSLSWNRMENYYPGSDG